MRDNDQCWIVRAEWANSGPTYHGVFTCYEDAEAWARDRLDDDAACTRYDLGVLTPAGSSVLSDPLPRSGRDWCPGGPR